MATRRLPVIQEPTGEDAEAAARPAWHWVLIGSGLLVTIWAPSAVVALAIARKIAAGRPDAAAAGAGVATALVALTFALASMVAGYLVARFGVRTARRHASFAGLLAVVEIWILALLGRAFPSGSVALSALLVLSGLAAVFCTLGAWLRRRKNM